MHCRMLQRVLFLQSFVVVFVRVFVTRFVVGTFHFAESELQSRSPTGVALMTVVQPDDAEKDGALSEISTETAPKRVPLPGLIGHACHLQYPVPNCQRSGPQTL